jgi:hypothetical protein
MTWAALIVGAAIAGQAPAAAAPAAGPTSDRAPAPTAPAGAIKPASNVPQLLVLNLDAIDVPPDKVSILNGRIASLLSARTDVETVTSADMQAMAQIDASKAAMGCDEASCLAEMASALGARYVIYGRVGRLDDVILLQVNLFDASVGKPISRQEAQGAQLKELSATMPKLINDLLRPLGGAPVTQAAVVEQPAVGPPSQPLSSLVLIGGGVAAVGVVAAGALGVWALGLDADLGSAQASLDQKQFAYDYGWAGIVVAAGGASLAAVGFLE